MRIFNLRIVDLVNPYKWRAYFQGKHLEQEVGYHYCEQVVIRSLLCEQCLNNGKCLHCGCATPDHFMASDNFCSQGMWTAMIDDPEEWEKFKKASGFKLKLEFDGSN